MTSITKRLKQIQSEIRRAEFDAQRKVGSVQLLAVSKTKPSVDIIEAYQAGQRHFGESYLQEALIKQKELGCFQITWHFIGPIQSNKTRQIASHFSWVHSIDRLKIAQRLSEQRPDYLPPLNICLQVNISNEPSKSGLQLDEIPEITECIFRLPNIKLRGVMAIPKATTDFEQQRIPYRHLYHSIKAEHSLSVMDTFSFGMSGDLRAAIMEGATIVRLGTAIFGMRS